jgi:organic hydroperoxide reductase OsmC/OhrA
MDKEHKYSLTIQWTGNKGSGTTSYRTYERSHLILAENKPEIFCSSDPHFLGDRTKYNPEELFVASLSACHMLWYLHLCSDRGIIILDYLDHAQGTMVETPDGGGYFSGVDLFPKVMVRESDMLKGALELHHRAGELCFLANSVKFPVRHHPTCQVTK